jgi:RNA polymerase sigma-70 factor (ECF subfamily)
MPTEKYRAACDAAVRPRRSSTISRTSMGQSRSHDRSMITASRSPNRRIPHFRSSPSAERIYLLSRIESAVRQGTSGIKLFLQDGSLGWVLNRTFLLSVLVDVTANMDAPHSHLPSDADAAIRQLYFDHAGALSSYVRRFCLDQAGADDIVQETFIRAWRHLPQLRGDGRPIRPWLFRVARNLLTDAERAARTRPVTVPASSADYPGDESTLGQILDRQLICDALQHLSPAHRAVLVETFYHGGTTAVVARQLGIPPGTARSRLHYALRALRAYLQDRCAVACP